MLDGFDSSRTWVRRGHAAATFRIEACIPLVDILDQREVGSRSLRSGPTIQKGRVFALRQCRKALPPPPSLLLCRSTASHLKFVSIYGAAVALHQVAGTRAWKVCSDRKVYPQAN